MGLGDRIAGVIRRWLKVDPAWRSIDNVRIREQYTYETDAMRDRIWYRGDADELRQFYGQVSSDSSSSRFWSAVPPGPAVRKLHSGLPAQIVDTLTGIVMGDYDGMDFPPEEKAAEETWAEMQEAISYPAAVSGGVSETLIVGGGAWKICWDTAVSEYPYAVFAPEDRITYHTRNGVPCGLSIHSDHTEGNNAYQLEERYEPGSIRYILRDRRGDPVPLDTVPELSGLQDADLPDGLMAAVPLQVFPSSRWQGRGRSIYANKTDAFDALDEVVSQWMDAIRHGRVIRYIPENMIPRDKNTGALSRMDDFGADYVRLSPSMGSDDKEADKIQVTQPEIRYEAYLGSYKAVVDMCLQGILSPATLGINIAADSSGESQRERKDATGFTRNAITAVLETALPKLAAALLQVYDWLSGRPIGEYHPSVSFGEYAAPDFATRVKTIREADAAGAMSVEAKVEELYGGSKEQDWIDAEIARLKAEQGISDAGNPPSGKDDLP